MSYIIKLYARYGTSSGTDKPYTATYYYPVFELTQEEFNTIQIGDIITGRPPVLTARGEVLNSLIQFSLAANEPQIVFDTHSRDFTEFISYANACGFITGSNTNTVVNFSGNPYVDIAADADFTTLLVNNLQTNSVPANELAYLFYSLSSTNGAIGKYPFIIKVGNLYYLNRFLVQYNNNNFYGVSISVFRHYANIDSILSNIEPYVPQTDPYAPGGISGEEGGTGNFDLTSDTIAVPNLPTLSAVNAGLVSVYVPTLGELNSFASLIFGSTFLNAFLNAVTTLFVDPLEAVIGLAILPVEPLVGSYQNVKVAYIPLTTPDGNLQMQPATSQYVEVNCGTIHVDEYSGSALDYAPYSKFHIYLPYIGTRELSTDEIRNKDLNVTYHVDIVSGSCLALLTVEGSVLYQFAGNCATPIPINGRDFSRMITASIQLAASFAGVVAGAGAGAAAAGNIQPPSDYISTPSSFATLVKTLDSDEGIEPTKDDKTRTKNSAEHLVSSTAGVVSGMKPHIQHASGIGGSAGMLGVQKPYLIAEIPRQSLAADYNKFVGYPSNITSKLGDLTGFTQIEMIHLKNIVCTETELAEINDLLMSGVIL